MNLNSVPNSTAVESWYVILNTEATAHARTPIEVYRYGLDCGGFGGHFSKC